jgi:hypothetical protein
MDGYCVQVDMSQKLQANAAFGEKGTIPVRTLPESRPAADAVRVIRYRGDFEDCLPASCRD